MTTNPTPGSPAAILRRAADLLREHATAATPGPWRQHDTHLGALGGHTATVLSGARNTTELRAWLPSMSQDSWDERRNVWDDAAYMALMHPGVGAALADWLGCQSMLTPEEREGAACGWCGQDHAAVVARALLGEGEQR